MSRPPFWQPGDKWQPPIVRLKGVDEKSPVGRQLLTMYEGRIKQFYLGQARAHALGISDSSRGTRQFPDARMTYINMMGQEIVDVEVRPELVEDVSEKLKQRHIPRYVFLEVAIPIVSAPTYANFIWRQVRNGDESLLTFPARTQQPDMAVSINNSGQWALDSPLVETAGLWGTGTREVTSMVTRAACWFDLSDHARNGTVARIQLYGKVQKSVDQTESLLGLVRVSPAIIGSLDVGRIPFDYYITSAMDAIGYYMRTTDEIRSRDFNEFFYHNPDLLGKVIALNSAGPGGLDGFVFTSNGDGTVTSTSVAPIQQLTDPTGPPNYLHSPQLRQQWISSGPFDGSAISVQLNGLVTDYRPNAGFREIIPPDVVINPVHPRLGVVGRLTESWFWVGQTGERLTIPTIYNLPMTPVNVYDYNVETNFNGGDWTVTGLDYLGRFDVYVPEYSVSFQPVS